VIRQWLAAIFDFRHVDARRGAFLVLLAAAILSPNISTIASLPAIRLEQILLAAYLPSLALYYRRNRDLWTFSLVDIAFAALAVSMAITLALAPVFLSAVSWSLRDPFELARVAEYWFLYRLGLTVIPDRTLGRQSLALLLGLGIILSAFSFVQYLAPGGFNDAVTSIWAVDHNLDGVQRTGRVVGTIGNANYYGITSAFFLILALSVMLVGRKTGVLGRWLAPVAVFAATLSVVMAQSRTAVAALLFAMTIGLVIVMIRRRAQAAYAPAIGLFLVSAVVSIGFVEVVKPEVGSFHARFAPDNLSDDTSVGFRLSRLKSIFAGFFNEAPSFCQGERLETIPPASGHEPGTSTGAPPAGSDALARDEQRKEDVAVLTRAVLDYFCAEDEWPAGLSLPEAVIPRHLKELPLDPLTGDPYLAYFHRSGIMLGANLENPADPDGPLYALGTIPNIAGNPSFESDGNSLASWAVSGGASVARVTTEALFGKYGAALTLPPGGSFIHAVPFDFTRDASYTAALWLRTETEAQVQIYLAATMTDGTAVDPFEQQIFTLEPGSWQRIALTFQTPAEGRIGVLRFIIRIPGNAPPAELLVDGATVTQGAFPPSFRLVRDVSPSSLKDEGLPRFSDSPIIGAGPRKDIQLGNIDNEYGLFLDRYGILGMVSYLVLFAGAFLLGVRAWRSEDGFVSILGLALVTFTLALAVFNITAGSYYHFQIMAVYWLIAGLLASSCRIRRQPEGAHATA
jgi:hypothetical protein